MSHKRWMACAAGMLALAALLCLPASAASGVPYTSYHVWDGMGASYTLAGRDLYEPIACIQTDALGIGAMQKPQDVRVQDGLVYLLDSKNSRVVVLNGGDYSLNRVIAPFTQGGQEVEFEDAQGLFVSGEGQIFIADTQGERVLRADGNGQILQTYTRPVSEVFPEDLEFKPIKLVLNEYGYLFVLCDGCYYGALVFDPNGNFCNFYGSNISKEGI